MSEILTLLLAWRMAKQYNENESKAIYLCAVDIWKQVKHEDMQNIFRQLADKKTPEWKRIKAVQQLEIQLRKEKML